MTKKIPIEGSPQKSKLLETQNAANTAWGDAADTAVRGANDTAEQRDKRERTDSISQLQCVSTVLQQPEVSV